MKVLHILNEIEFSGAEVMLEIAASTFIANGFKLHVLSTGEDIGRYATSLNNVGYSVHHIPFRKSPGYFIRLYGFLRKEEFDLVHIHPERAFFWHAVTAKLARVRVVLRTVHNVFLFSGFLRFKRMVQRHIARNLLGVRFISIGPSVRVVEEKVFHNTTYLIPNWIDQSRFSHERKKREIETLRYKFGILSTDFVIISVGSCSKQKNHRAIIAAVAQAQKKINNIVYLHVGDGHLLRDETEFARENGVLSNTRFFGKIENIREALSVSDVFVMASTHEGLSIASLEAMSCGLPVIAYNVYGLRDVVEDGKNGILVEPNSHALAKAIEKLALSSELRLRMGIEAYESVSRNFNMKQSLDNLIRVYGGYGPV